MTQAVETIAKEEYVPSTALGALSRATKNDEGIMDALVDELFTYHAWTPEMIANGEQVRKDLAQAFKTILLLVPSSPSRTRALNCLTDARMLANAAITFKGVV